MYRDEKVEKIVELLEMLRPAIQADGGDVSFVRYEDGVVFVRFKGACVSCPMSAYTLKMGIEATLKEQLPEIKEIVNEQ